MDVRQAIDDDLWNGEDGEHYIARRDIHQPIAEQESRRTQSNEDEKRQLTVRGGSNENHFLLSDAASLRRIVLEGVNTTRQLVLALEKTITIKIGEIGKRVDDNHAALSELALMMVSKQGNNQSKSQRQVFLDAKVEVLKKVLSADLVQLVIERCVLSSLDSLFGGAAVEELVKWGALSY